MSVTQNELVDYGTVLLNINTADYDGQMLM